MKLIAIRHALCALASFALTPAIHAQPGPEIQPTSVELTAQPGETRRQVLTLTNTGEQEQALTIGLADWTLSRDGALRLSPPAPAASPVTEWVRFTPAYVTIPPGERRRVIVDVAIPEDLPHAGDYRFAVLASAIEPDARTGLMEKTELSSLFYLTASPAVSDPVVTDIRLQRRSGGSPVLEVDLSNSGNAHARLDGEIVITGKTGERIVLPVSNLVVLESQQRRFSVPVKQDIPQDARVTVTLDNIFAPQAGSGVAPLREFSSPLSAPGTP
ncbi:hypothetical protein [Henriciella sp.]|uniref:hypothetical protein n=1 Tax=Henriciella sp. TaxID=1968823 RepID=UPI002638EC98|nr:hypothetical protein [Henriciella sp.]